MSSFVFEIIILGEIYNILASEMCVKMRPSDTVISFDKS